MYYDDVCLSMILPQLRDPLPFSCTICLINSNPFFLSNSFFLSQAIYRITRASIHWFCKIIVDLTLFIMTNHPLLHLHQPTRAVLWNWKEISSYCRFSFNSRLFSIFHILGTGIDLVWCCYSLIENPHIRPSQIYIKFLIFRHYGNNIYHQVLHQWYLAIKNSTTNFEETSRSCLGNGDQGA